MLAEADLDLIRRDAALPGLSSVLDETAVEGMVRAANPGLPIESVRLRYLRYKPATNCVAAYVVRRAGGAEVLWTAKAWQPGTAGKLELPGAVEALHGEELRGCLDAVQGVALGAFPWDPKLKSLRRWATEEGRRRFCEDRHSLRGLVEATGFGVLNFKPERRLVGRLDTRAGRPVAVVKVHTEDDFRAAWAAHQTVRSGPSFEVPEVIGKSRHHATVVLRWREGTGLEGVLSRPGALERQVLRSVGCALSELHAQAGDGLPRVTLARGMARVQEQANVLAWLLPREEAVIRRCAHWLTGVVGNAPDGEGLVHGDFYAKQVLVQDGRLIILDLDAAARGPAWIDLATFGAHLELDVLRGRLDRASADVALQDVMEGYRREAAPPGAREFPGLVAVELFSQASHLFRSRHPAWEHATRQVLARVAQLCEGLHAPGARPNPKPTAAGRDDSSVARSVVPQDPALPFLEEALDVDAMAVRLATAGTAAARELVGCRLETAQLTRHKPGRRAMIEYRFVRLESGERFAWLGKVTRRGGPSRSAEVVRALRGAGLDDRSEVAIPEPMGGVAELHLELQRRVSGTGVWSGLAGVDGPELGRRCAEAISRVHESGVTTERRHGLGDEWSILETRLRSLAPTHAAWGSRLEKVLEACAEISRECTETREALVHRDFHPDQVLVAGSRLWLVDFDLCAMGDPWVDHGNFLAHVVEGALRASGRHDALEAVEASYRESVLTRLGTSHRASLDAWFLLSLARHLQLCTLYPQRSGWFPRLLEAWEERCDRTRAAWRRSRSFTLTPTL